MYIIRKCLNVHGLTCFSVDLIQQGKYNNKRTVSMVGDLTQVERACTSLQEKLTLVLEYVEEVLVSSINHSVICKGHHCIGLVTLLILFVPLTVNTIFVGKQNSTRHKHREVFTRFNQQCP